MHLKLGITKADELNTRLLGRFRFLFWSILTLISSPWWKWSWWKGGRKGGGEIRGTRLEERSAGNCGAIKFIEFKDTSLESGGNEFVVWARSRTFDSFSISSYTIKFFLSVSADRLIKWCRKWFPRVILRRSIDYH